MAHPERGYHAFPGSLMIRRNTRRILYLLLSLAGAAAIVLLAVYGSNAFAPGTLQRWLSTLSR